MKHFSNQSQILMKREIPIVDGGDAAGFLPAMLQGIKRIISGVGAASVRVIDAEYAAFFMD